MRRVTRRLPTLGASRSTTVVTAREYASSESSSFVSGSEPGCSGPPRIASIAVNDIAAKLATRGGAASCGYFVSRKSARWLVPSRSVLPPVAVAHEGDARHVRRERGLPVGRRVLRQVPLIRTVGGRRVDLLVTVARRGEDRSCRRSTLQPMPTARRR